MTAGLRIEILTSFAEAWRDLREEAFAGYGFQTRAWLETYAETLGAAGGERPVLVLVSDERLRMLVPLSLTRRRGVRTLAFLGGGVTDYNAPLVDPVFARGLDAGAMAALWRDIRARLPRHDIVGLVRMPVMLDAPGVDASVPNPFALLPGTIVSGMAHAASLADGPPAPRSEAANIRRRARNLAKLGPVILDVAREHAERAALVDRLMAMKSRRWRETGARDWSGVDAFRAFYDRIAALPDAAFAAHASSLRCGEAVIAAHLGFRYRGRFYLIQFGWEGGEWRRYGPGLHFVDALLHAATDNGMALFDFTGGDEAYKQIWADRTLPLLSVRRGATMLGRAILVSSAAAATVSARLKRIERLRAAVRRIRGRPRA